MKVRSILRLAAEVLALMMLLCSCSLMNLPTQNGAPLTSEEKTDTADYLKVNNYVRKRLENNFVGTLPDAEFVQSHDTEYYYRYDNDFFGDVYFTLYVKVKDAGEQEFSDEKERIAPLAVREFEVDGKTVYLMNEIPDFDYYFYYDSKSYDGLGIMFNLVVFHNETGVIEYLNEVYQDTSEKLGFAEKMISLLKDAGYVYTPPKR